MRDSFIQAREYKDYLVAKRKALPTILSYISEINSFFGWLGRHYPSFEVYQIRRKLIEEYITSEKVNGKQITTINKKITVLRSYFDFLWNKGIIPVDPCGKYKRIKDVDEDREYFITQEQMNSFLEMIEQPIYHSNEKSQYRTMAIVSLMVGAGLRVQEVVNLLWKDVIKEDNRYIIGVTVGEKMRRVILAKEKAKWFMKYRSSLETEESFVFPSSHGNQISIRNVQLILNSLSKKTGVYISAQKLRNTFAVLQLLNGYSRDEVANMMGIKQLVIPDHIWEQFEKKEYVL